MPTQGVNNNSSDQLFVCIPRSLSFLILLRSIRSNSTQLQNLAGHLLALLPPTKNWKLRKCTIYPCRKTRRTGQCTGIKHCYAISFAMYRRKITFTANSVTNRQRVTPLGPAARVSHPRRRTPRGQPQRRRHQRLIFTPSRIKSSESRWIMKSRERSNDEEDERSLFASAMTPRTRFRRSAGFTRTCARRKRISLKYKQRLSNWDVSLKWGQPMSLLSRLNLLAIELRRCGAKYWRK